MTTELQNKVWSILPKEFKEEVNEIYANAITHHPCGYNHKTDLLKYLFGHHNLTSDAEGEEMLTVSRKQIDALQDEIFKSIMDASDADDWQTAAHYILDVMPRSFAALFGTKCLPDEDVHEDNFANKKPEPAEPKNKDCDNHLAGGGKMMDLRLNIAAMAMQGILSNADRMKVYECVATEPPCAELTVVVARKALRYADALIAEAKRTDKLNK